MIEISNCLRLIAHQISHLIILEQRGRHFCPCNRVRVNQSTTYLFVETFDHLFSVYLGLMTHVNHIADLEVE